ncbi:MAG: protein kinase [Candidatus Aminicenantes bacterium]
MPRRMKDILAQRALANFVGRTEEMKSLLKCLEDECPLVVHVHGIGGVGKSALVQAFSVRAKGQGATVVILDSPLIEPTERGFLQELGHAIGLENPTFEEVIGQIEILGPRVFLVIETYELFRLMDTWLRQVFVPALSENVRVILVGREPPFPSWLVAPEWQGLFSSIALGPLKKNEAMELLSRAGVSEKNSQRINRFAKGHPLTLKLAASAALERPSLDLQDMDEYKIIQELSRLFLVDVADQATREALEAASVARRITQSLLGAMLPDSPTEKIFNKLSALAFVDSMRDGLRVHDAVHEAIAASLRASDPSRYLEYRRSAWIQLRKEVKTIATRELWRYTADMLYLIENPVVREAFFPSGSQQLAVEPSRSGDQTAIYEITEKHESPEASGLLKRWWKKYPQTFHVVRGEEGLIVGYYCCFDPTTVEPSDFQEDPILQVWWNHLKENPAPANQSVLFLRRWLSLEHGEAPSPVQAACWLDIKRTYMELRPLLRRVYLTVIDLPTYAPVAVKLGFNPITDASLELDGLTHHTAMLDFGPSSVDGWLAGLVADELGIEEKLPPVEIHYRILDKLGAGGMGVVYRAEDTILKRQVALKFLPLESLGSDEGRARFLQEARTSAALNHPNICTVFEVSQVVAGSVLIPDGVEHTISEGSPFIAMELVEGPSLRTILDHSKALPFEQLLDISIQIAEGLAEAHSRGFIHRDLKPQNVMLTEKGRLKILDFGLAKAVEYMHEEGERIGKTMTLPPELTQQGMIVGTLAYMSPEQIEGQDVDTRSDIFSFGTMLYEMASGKNPYQGKSTTKTMYNILEVKPKPVSELRSELPVPFEEITLRCLSKNREDRYDDAHDLLADLMDLKKSLR